jgi:gas vesicle protein
MSEQDDFGSFLVGFVVGGLTGAVVALLFAPQSGEETRTVIKEKGIELRDKASQTAEEALASAQAAAQPANLVGAGLRPAPSCTRPLSARV